MTDDVSTQRCGKCGAENSADNIFCATCGAVLSAYAPPLGAEAPDVPESTPVLVDDSIVAPPPTDPRPAPKRLTPLTDDWRELFSRPVVATEPTESHSPGSTPPESPVSYSYAPSSRTKSVSRAKETNSNEPNVPAETARPRADRSQQARQPQSTPIRANPAPITPATSVPVLSTRMLARRSGGLPSIVLAGIALAVFSCLLFGLTAAIGESGAGPAFALFCLFPIGIVMVAAGLVRMVKQNKDGDQDQT